jgi:hypothetical protein
MTNQLEWAYAIKNIVFLIICSTTCPWGCDMTLQTYLFLGKFKCGANFLKTRGEAENNKTTK